MLELSLMSIVNLQKVIFYNISLYSYVNNIVPTCDVSYSALPLICDYN